MISHEVAEAQSEGSMSFTCSGITPSACGSGRRGSSALPGFLKRPRLLWVVGLMGLVLLTGGCVSKKSVKEKQRTAYMAGRQQAIIEMQEKQLNVVNQVPLVTVSGPVKFTEVEWAEGLTLAQTVVAAQYTGRRNPNTVIVNRAGERFQIRGWELLAGHDFPLEPGDHIEIIP